MLRFRFTPLLITFLLLPLYGQAQDENDGTLHVLRPTIHAEQDKAELCLEFDHALDLSDHGRVAANVHLESDTKTVTVAAQNLTLTNTSLCLPSLDHRQDYRLTLSGLRGAKGEKLTAPYSLSFTVPDRQPSLAFASDPESGGLTRWSDNDPVLRVVNVPKIHLEFYRITDTAQIGEAWRQRMQTALAPSESATFAKNKGQLLWQNDIIQDHAPNASSTQKVPLHTAVGDAPPGLYLIVATAPDIKPQKDALAPLAAEWLLHSNLKLHAIPANDSFYVTSEKADASGSLSSVHLKIQTENQQGIVEGKSGEDGTTFLSVPNDKRKDAATLVGWTDGGDVDFVDLSLLHGNTFALPDLEASLSLDHTVYAPGSNAIITFSAHDVHNHPVVMTDSSLQILRPDHSLYASLPVPKPQDINALTPFLALPVPMNEGLWSLVWQKNDDRPLAETKLRISGNPDSPRLEMTADRPMLSDNGDIVLLLKSTTSAGKIFPYLSGHIAVSWTTPNHLFPGWDDYHFGSGSTGSTPSSVIASFITDEKGGSQLHVNVPMPNDASPLHVAILSAKSDPAVGAINPLQLTLPVKPKDFIIGVMPSAVDGKFAENSLAHFSIVALDPDGKRRAVDDLTYQIYEEGRSFEWHQADGKWDYKPLQQQRRAGGGALSFAADGGGINWPVTAGAYRLDISDANGDLLARYHFNAGWGLSRADLDRPAKLLLSSTTGALHAGVETKIHFTLDKAAMVSVFIADERVRKIIHQPMPQGDNEIAFTPQDDWGDRAGIWVFASPTDVNGHNENAAGQLVIATPQEKQVAQTASPVPDAKPVVSPHAAFDVAMSVLPSMRIGDTVQLSLDLNNNTASNGVYHYALMPSSGLKVAETVSGSANLAPAQHKALTITVTALAAGSQSLRLDLNGPHNFHAERTQNVAVSADNQILVSDESFAVSSQQSWSPAAIKPNVKPGFNWFFVALQPLYNLPAILTLALGNHPFSTTEIADQYEILSLWNDVIVAADLMPQAELQGRKADLLMQLLQRQKSDGGFPQLPDSASDLVSTSAALKVMANANQGATRIPTDQAAGWLRHQLENAWFDEHERPQRAAAYAALAAADRMDAANLHYFSDTSADKSLPSLAAAQMAAAFAKINDRPASQFWIKTAGPVTPEALTVLAANDSFNPQDALPALEKLSNDIMVSPQNSADVTHFLIAMAAIQARAGTWHAIINNLDRSATGVQVTLQPDRAVPFTLHNVSDKSLFVVSAHEADKPVTNGAMITRHLFEMNGNEITDGSVSHGDTYLVVLEGPMFSGSDDNPVVIHDDASLVLQSLGCTQDAHTDGGDSLSWLRGIILTPGAVCEQPGESIDVLIPRTDKDAKSWRIAYVAKAGITGSFNLPRATARTLQDDQAAIENRETRLRVR